MIGQWPWPRSTVRDLLLALTSKGASAVAFDVLFAEPDRTSIEAIVKLLPEREASAIKAATAGQPSNDELFAAALKDTPSVLSVALGEGASTTFQAKAGFVFGGDDPRPFLMAFKGASENLPELENAAHGIGAFNWVADRDQIVRRVALMFRLNESFVPSLAAEAIRVAQGATTYVLKASNASGETAFGQSTGLNHIRIGDIEVPTDGGEACISNSATLNRPPTFPPGRCWRGKLRRRTSRAGSFWSAPALLACSTCGPPQSTRPCRDRYSRAGHRAFADRPVSGAPRLRFGSRGICHPGARADPGFRIAADFSQSVRNCWLSHNSTRPIRRVGRLFDIGIFCSIRHIQSSSSAA